MVRCLFSVCLLGLLAPLGSAQSTWTPTTTDFNTAGNWSAGVPTLGTTGSFTNTPTAALRTLTFSADATAGILDFTGVITNPYTFTSLTNSLTINNGGTGAAITSNSASTANLDFNLAMNFADAGGVVVTRSATTGLTRFGQVGAVTSTIGAGGLTLTGAGNYTISTEGTFAGTGALTKSGSGTLTIAGANTFTGGMTITGGRVNFNATNAAGTGTITVTPASNVTLAYSSGTGATLPNAITLNSSANTIDLINSASTGAVFTLSGNLTGAGNLSRGIGGGVQLVALTGSNSGWSGNLILAGNSTSSVTPLFVAPSAFGTGNVQLGTTTFASVLLSNGTFARTLGTGPGEVQWVGTGATGLAARGGALSVTFNAGADLTWGSGNFVNAGQPLALGAAGFADNVVTLTNNIDFGSVARTVNVVDNTTSTTDRGVLAGNLTNGSLTKTGNGTLQLSGTGNTLTGISLGGGDLAFTQANNLGTATLTVTSASTLAYEGASATTINNNVSTTAALSVQVTNPAGTLTMNGIITGTNTFVKFGPGALILPNPYGGGTSTTSVNEGVLTLSGGGQAQGTGNATVAALGTLRLDNSGTNNDNRLAGNLSLGGGDFRLIGNTGVATNEAVNTFSGSTAGTSFVTLDANGGPGVTLTATTYTAPTGGNLVVFRSPTLGTTNRVLLTSVGTSALLTNALGDDTLAGTGRFLVEHDATAGVREVTYALNGPIDNAGPTPTTANFRNNGAAGASATVGAANTIASLTLNGTNPTINASSGTLTVSSGTILVQPGTTGATISGGTLTTATNAPFNVLALANLNTTSALVTTGGLNKFGTGTLTIAGTGTVPNGTLAVNAGTVNLTTARANTVGTVNVPAGATLTNGASALTTGNLTLPAGGTFNTGTGLLTVNQTATTTINGTLNVGGSFTLLGGPLTLASQTAVLNTPASGRITVSAVGGAASGLILDNSAVATIPNRAPNAPVVQLNSSRLTLTGSNTAGQNTNQIFGALSGSGFAVVTMPTQANTSNVLRFASLQQNTQAGFYFHGGTGFGTAAPGNGVTNIFFTTPPVVSTTGGGAAGTNTVSVVLGVVGDNVASLSSLNGNLAAYSPTTGLRALTAAEQLVGFTGSTINTNVIFTTATTLPVGTTSVNSVVNAGSGVALNGTSPGSTLVVGSGQILYTFGSTTPGFGSLLTLDMNGQTGTIAFTGSSSQMILNSAVTNTGAGGLVINSNQVTNGVILGSTASNNNFNGLTINGGRGSATGTVFINIQFSAEANLGLNTGPITLNSARLSYTPTGTPITLNRPLRIGGVGAEFTVTTTTATFAGASTTFEGAGILDKTASGTLNLTPTQLTPGTVAGEPATLGINTTAGTTNLSLPAAGNYTWKLRGAPGSYTQDQVVLAGTTNLTIDPAALVTADLNGINRAALITDLGGFGNSRDYVLIDTVPTNTANFATSVVLLNAPGFTATEFSFLLNNGDVVLRFTPVPEPSLLLLVGGAVLGGLVRRRARRR